jgi:hypothetical protein
MKTCVIMQPTYLPWLGYFDLINKSDVFVYLDHVQFSKQSWQQRNKIRDRNGELVLTIPIKHHAHKETFINEVEIDNKQSPLKKHFKSIQLNYIKSKNYKLIIEEIEEIYSKEYNLLMDLNVELIRFGCKRMGLQSDFIYSSSLDVEGQRVEALIDMCKKLGATHYLSPLGSKTYIDENNIFEENGIRLSYQEYTHPVYQQINYDNFISHLAFIDYLFNV